MKRPILTLVVPCYNEEEVFFDTKNKLVNTLQEMIDHQLISTRSKILFVDDGSKDHTWAYISEAVQTNPLVSGIKLSRNFGHQKALLAGLSTAVKQSDCIVSIDADLQDDVAVIEEFVKKYDEGFDIVYGVRKSRAKDTVFKRSTAQGFYSLMNRMGLQMVYNHADYRLMSRRAVEALLTFKETNLFLRGMVPLVGYKFTKVYYDRKERLAGESKYPLKKMLAFAFDGITSFSIQPIRLITILGFLSTIISFVAGLYAIFEKVFGNTQEGWASLMISIWFIGGLLLMSIGLIGEYIGKIYEEVKGRPRFIIETDLSTNEPALSSYSQKEHVLR
jgi:polyisoprenyl-phosphate glycosyltransferase